MPIVFAQPAPVSPPISAAAGAAEQFDRFAPVLQRQQESLAQQYMQMASLSQRAASDQADRGQRSAEFGATMDFRRDAEQQQAGQQQAEMQFRAAQQQAAQQHETAQTEQRARLMQEAATAELSQREKVELSRLEMAAGSVRNNPNLGAEEKNDLLTQIYSKRDPLANRRARAQVKQDELENQKLQKHLGEMDLIASQRAEFNAGRLQATTVDLKDADGNYLSTAVVIPGETKPHFINKKEQQAAAQEKVELAKQKMEQDHQNRLDAYNHKRGEMYAKIDQDVAREVNADREKHPNAGSVDWEERERVLKKQRKAEYLEGNPPPKSPGGQGPTPNVGGQDQPEERPFQYTDPKTQSVRQRSVVGELNKQWDTVFNSAAPPEVKDEAFRASQQIGMMLGKYGSVRQMEAKDPPAYAEFVEQTKKMDAALKAAAGAKRPEQPPGLDTRTSKQKFEQGELVTASGVAKTLKPALDQLRAGELVTIEKIMGASPDGRSVFQRFDQGDLVTIQGILDAINSASPFKRK